MTFGTFLSSPVDHSDGNLGLPKGGSGRFREHDTFVSRVGRLLGDRHDACFQICSRQHEYSNITGETGIKPLTSVLHSPGHFKRRENGEKRQWGHAHSDTIVLNLSP